MKRKSSTQQKRGGFALKIVCGLVLKTSGPPSSQGNSGLCLDCMYTQGANNTAFSDSPLSLVYNTRYQLGDGSRSVYVYNGSEEKRGGVSLFSMLESVLRAEEVSKVWHR